MVAKPYVSIQVDSAAKCALAAIQFSVFVMREALVITSSAAEAFDAKCRVVAMVDEATAPTAAMS